MTEQLKLLSLTEGRETHRKTLLPVTPSIRKHLVSQARGVPSMLQSRLKTQQLTQPGAGCSASATRAELVPPVGHTGVSQRRVPSCSQISFALLCYSRASRHFLPNRLFRVLRTGAFDAAKCDEQIPLVR